METLPLPTVSLACVVSGLVSSLLSATLGLATSAPQAVCYELA